MKAAGEPARLESHPRTRVAQIVMDYARPGWSPDQIQRQHPCLTHAEIHSAPACHFDHTEEIEREIEQTWEEAHRLAERIPPARTLFQLKSLKRGHAGAALS